MRYKNKLIDRLELKGSQEQQAKIALERLQRLKENDFSFLEYGIKKQTLITKIILWTKRTSKKMTYKVRNFKK